MTVIITDARERARFLRFAFVGVIGAIVDFGVMNLLTTLVGASLVVAGTIAFIAAIISNFLWNRYWTYPDSRSKPITRQLVQFVLISVMGLGIRIPLLRVLEPIMKRLFEWLTLRITNLPVDFLAKNSTLAIAVVVVMFWNFFANRYWTYNDVS
jgi:putative flippase GtrA